MAGISIISHVPHDGKHGMDSVGAAEARCGETRAYPPWLGLNDANGLPEVPELLGYDLEELDCENLEPLDGDAVQIGDTWDESMVGLSFNNGFDTDEVGQMYSYQEHLDALHSAPLDETYRRLRGRIQDSEIRGHEQVAAAVIKAHHDLRFWRPLLELGIQGVFTGHFTDLKNDVKLLELHRPSVTNKVLREGWLSARSMLQSYLPTGIGRASTRVVGKGRRAGSPARASRRATPGASRSKAPRVQVSIVGRN